MAKKTNQKQALIIGLVLIVLVVLYVKRADIKDYFVKPSTAKSNQSATKEPITANNTTSGTLLKRGSEGKEVQKLQILLNDHHRKRKPTFIALLEEDGKFGKLTENMLKKYTGKTAMSVNELTKTLK